MAGGWARDGAVQDQIEDTVSDAVLAARAAMPARDAERSVPDAQRRGRSA
jgi:hypothetical protein